MELNLDNYSYDLPDNRIARFPLQKRDESKLLFYDRGNITHHAFRDVATLLPSGSHLVFNETRVIPARLFFRKSTGAIIEVMLLDPVEPSTEMNTAMACKGAVTWKCLIRNLRKWKQDERLARQLDFGTAMLTLSAYVVNRKEQWVKFEWSDTAVTFSEILAASGEVPLPPYLKRKPVQEDRTRYQTVYSKIEGAVAAPTAGLHFTEEVFQQLKDEGHTSDFLTLHVSAGTFQPIKEKDIREHDMHAEKILLSSDNIRNLIQHQGNIIAVGTTSLRTLESVYWFGVKLLRRESQVFHIEKLYPFTARKIGNLPPPGDALGAVIRHMDANNLGTLQGITRIFIFPGYKFQICKGLITNYHMPRSTLILLVAALVGEDWRQIYAEALAENYRFLSYGDSSLLIPA